MSQALHTSSTGINAGQSQINVIANNVANINTTAYKSANMVFETLFSNNLSYGSAATKDGGGTNPKQIGLGVKVGGITRNFTPGNFVQTGRDLDCMISGAGFFVVQDADGKQYFTRDGVFSMDSAGNLVTQSGLKVVAATTNYSNASSSKTVNVPMNLRAVVSGDPDLATKKISELNGGSIKSGTVMASINGSGPIPLVVPENDPTMQDIVDSFNKAIADANIDDAEFAINNKGQITTTGKITYLEEGTTSNFVGQTGLSNSSTSKVMNSVVDIQDVINYNDSDSHSISSKSIDENGILIATYDDGSTLTQYLDGTYSVQWKYTTPEGIIITGNDVTATGASIANSNFVIELATMVNEEGMISLNNNLWELGPDTGSVFYGMAGEMSFGPLETGGYEGSNVDIATELSNMIMAQRMIQMNSRVFGTASSVMETLSYLGQ